MGHRAQGLKLVVAAALVLLNAGWGAEGHRIVGRIAEARMSDATRQAVARLLGNQSLADVSTWADEIKSDHSWDWAKPLHYVNMPYGASGFDHQRDCADDQCVVGAIEHYADVLRSPAATRDEQIVALKFLVHFVGDIHQPLHACYAEDRGGNRIKVQFFGQGTNLHKLWDTDLLVHRIGDQWAACADRLVAALTDEEAARLAADLDPAAWATESFGIAQKSCYALPRDQQVGDEYYQRNITVIDQRLTAAGVRLAALLDSIVAAAGNGDAAAPPDAPAATEPPADPGEDPAAFVEIVLADACGRDGGQTAVLRNRHEKRLVRVTVVKRWMDGDRPMSREATYTVRPGEERQRELGCTRAGLRGGGVREFTWEIVSAEWR